ncbi:MAG: hypothetical protein ALAOOOJD_00651 [bacterium]|nr:hypothetical protein [bacterium]
MALRRCAMWKPKARCTPMLISRKPSTMALSPGRACGCRRGRWRRPGRMDRAATRGNCIFRKAYKSLMARIIAGKRYASKLPMAPIGSRFIVIGVITLTKTADFPANRIGRRTRSKPLSRKRIDSAKKSQRMRLAATASKWHSTPAAIPSNTAMALTRRLLHRRCDRARFGARRCSLLNTSRRAAPPRARIFGLKCCRCSAPPSAKPRKPA